MDRHIPGPGIKVANLPTLQSYRIAQIASIVDINHLPITFSLVVRLSLPMHSSGKQDVRSYTMGRGRGHTGPGTNSHADTSVSDSRDKCGHGTSLNYVTENCAGQDSHFPKSPKQQARVSAQSDLVPYLVATV